MARTDSAWLNKHLIDPNEYQIGYQSDKSEIVIQINGKRRAEIKIEKDTTEEKVFNEIKNIQNISDALSGKNVLKSIYVPNKILNIVLKS